MISARFSHDAVQHRSGQHRQIARRGCDRIPGFAGETEQNSRFTSNSTEMLL